MDTDNELLRRVETVDSRLQQVERTLRDEELAKARAEVHLTYLKERFDKVDNELTAVQDNMRATVQRLQWIVLTAIVLGVMDFILGGGLNSVP